MRKALFLALFTSILFFATVLRMYKLGSIPYSLYWDEMAMYVDVKSVLQTSRDMFGRPWFQVIYPSYGDFKLPVYIWFATASSKIFGLSEFSLRVPSVLAGVGTVFFAGLIARQILVDSDRKKIFYPQIIQLIAMLVVTVTPWAVMFSRTGFEGHVGQFFLSVSVWCALVASEAKKNSRNTHIFFLFLAPIFGALATYSYFSVRFVWPVVFLAAEFLLVTPFWRWQKKKQSIFWWGVVEVGLPICIFASCLLPMLHSPLYNDSNTFRLGTDSVLKGDYVIQSNVLREMAGNTRIDRVIFSQHWLMTRELLKNYADNLSPNFLFFTGDPNLRHGTGQTGLFLTVFLPFFTIGFFGLLIKKRRVFAFFIIWWLAALLPASVPENTPHALRALNALMPLSLIISYGFFQTIEWIWKNSFFQRRLFRFTIVTAIATCALFSFCSFWYHYVSFYPQESADSWQDGYKQLAQEIYIEKTPEMQVIISPFDDRFYLWLMAYGPYSGKDFQSWQSEKYQFQHIPEITFQDFDERNLKNFHGALLVAGRPERVRSPFAQSTKEVYGGGGKLQFVVQKFTLP
jgi:4-amino-4-deoxy-L-arabinose transferase-like glycosyltransferase